MIAFYKLLFKLPITLSGRIKSGLGLVT